MFGIVLSGNVGRGRTAADLYGGVHPSGERRLLLGFQPFSGTGVLPSSEKIGPRASLSDPTADGRTGKDKKISEITKKSLSKTELLG